MRRPGSRGFTLLEILIVLVVAGLLLAGFAVWMGQGLGISERQQGLSRSQNDFEAVNRLLRDLIGQADPGSGELMSGFQGDPGRLVFPTEAPVLPRAVGPQSVRRLEVALGVDGTHRLMLRWTPLPRAHWLGPPPGGSETVLAERIERLEITYADRTAHGLVWKAAWTAKAPPAAVRVRAVFPLGDRRRWPEMIVALARNRP